MTKTMYAFLNAMLLHHAGAIRNIGSGWNVESKQRRMTSHQNIENMIKLGYLEVDQFRTVKDVSYPIHVKIKDRESLIVTMRKYEEETKDS